jgi:hypothetical protein
MYDYIRRLSLKQASVEVPVFLLALLIAELFYKFRSFLLETGAFLLTWFILSAVVSTVRSMMARPSDQTQP